MKEGEKESSWLKGKAYTVSKKFMENTYFEKKMINEFQNFLHPNQLTFKFNFPRNFFEVSLYLIPASVSLLTSWFCVQLLNKQFHLEIQAEAV